MVANEVRSLRMRVEMGSCFKYLRLQVPRQVTLSFSWLELDLEPVSAVLDALAASRGQLRRLCLTANACVRMDLATPAERDALAARLAELKGSVIVEVTTHQSRLLAPLFRKRAHDSFPKMQCGLSVILLRTARLFLAVPDNIVHRLSLPPIMMFDHVTVDESWVHEGAWALLDQVLSNDRLRLRLSGVAVDFDVFLHLEDIEALDGDEDVYATLGVRLEAMMLRLARHPMRLLTLYGSSVGFHTAAYLASVQVDCLRMCAHPRDVSGWHVSTEAPEVVNNPRIRSVELLFPLGQHSLLACDTPARGGLTALLSREYADGVRLSAFAPPPDAADDLLLEGQLKGLCLSACMRLDLQLRSVPCSTLRSALVALASNPSVRRFHLALTALTALTEPAERVLELPIHVTSACLDFSDFEPDFDAFSHFLSDAALPGVEALEVSMPKKFVIIGLRRLLEGAPRLRRLVLRATGRADVLTEVGRALLQKCAPGVLDVTVHFTLLDIEPAASMLPSFPGLPVSWKFYVLNEAGLPVDVY